MSQLNKIDFKVFCEKLPFDSLFSSESQVFLVGFLCVLKMYHVRLYIVEKIGFGIAPRLCEIHFKPQPLLQKTCIFHASKPQMRTQECAYVCMLWPTYTHIRGPRATLIIFFQKQIFAHLKGFIFHFNTPQVNFIYDQVMSQPQVLEFKHH